MKQSFANLGNYEQIIYQVVQEIMTNALKINLYGPFTKNFIRRERGVFKK